MAIGCLQTAPPRMLTFGARANRTRPLAQMLRRVFCALRGHDFLLHFERTRLSLRCSTCGRETPGWPVESSRMTRIRHLAENSGRMGVN